MGIASRTGKYAGSGISGGATPHYFAWDNGCATAMKVAEPQQQDLCTKTTNTYENGRNDD